jgi:hypothetical protein
MDVIAPEGIAALGKAMSVAMVSVDAEEDGFCTTGSAPGSNKSARAIAVRISNVSVRSAGG